MNLWTATPAWTLVVLTAALQRHACNREPLARLIPADPSKTSVARRNTENDTLTLRYGAEAEHNVRMPKGEISGLQDIAWDQETNSVWFLRYVSSRWLLTRFTLDRKELISLPLPKGLMPGSRLIRQGSSICLLAGAYKPSHRRVLLSLAKESGEFTETPIGTRTDFDEQVAAEKAEHMRRALVASSYQMPIREEDIIDYRIGRSGTPANNAVRLGGFPVIVGHSERPLVRFDSRVTTAAIGDDRVQVLRRVLGKWRKIDVTDLVRAKVNRARNRPLRITSVYSNDGYVVFGVRAGVPASSGFSTILMDVTGRAPRITRWFNGLYAPPIQSVPATPMPGASKPSTPSITSRQPHKGTD